VRTETPTQPPTYYYLDVASQRATKIVSEYPALAPSDLGMTRPVTYKARDGLTIHAYLTLPPGRNDGKNLPMVVMPHGGPDARDRWRFDWWAQFLANRGYAVLQPNYRGSFGYGRAFAEAGFGQWGLKIQDDISDGVKAMIADGTADAKRICIVGASYGGYAALAGATFTPELYACAVSFAGVSDLSRMMLLVKKDFGEHSGAASFWESRIGTDPAQLDATSPALHADRVRAPVLLLHGKLDTTVPIVQSEEERDALQRAGKQVEYIEFDTDDHYFTLAETRIRMLTEVERFLRTHIGG
jgi:dipeptidyl aminopeptidase/acylaminoacyl peptidase